MHRAISRYPVNPFVDISSGARSLIVLYFIIWRILPQARLVVYPDSNDPFLSFLIWLTRIGCEALILWPFLLRSIGGTPIGWLHPFILPTVVGISFSILRQPGSLLSPISFWFEGGSPIQHLLIRGQQDVLLAQLKLSLLDLLALLATYAGFGVFRTTKQWFSLPKDIVHISRTRLALVFGLFFLIVVYFIESQGGLLTHMASLSEGRFKMREWSGQFLIVSNFLPYLLVLWYLIKPASLRNPIFIAAFLLACVTQFVVTGSRSSLFTPVATLLTAWMYVNHRIPAMRGILLGLTGLLFFGILGEIRSSGRSGEISFESLNEFSLSGAWEETQQQLEDRAIYPALAVVGLVPESEGFLFGQTYVAAVTFFIPRSIWEEKPRGAGAYVAALLYEGRKSLSGYQGAAFPPGATAEAYWNFGVSGVLLVFTLYGILTRFITLLVLKDQANPLAVMVLIFLLFTLDSPSTDEIVRFMQNLAMLCFTYLFVRRTASGIRASGPRVEQTSIGRR